MPRLSQLIIRTALAWLMLGSTLGGLLLLNKGVPLLPWLWTLRAAHIHILLVGWTVQLACGVAFWILPRLDARGSRGRQWPIWLCYGALNIGVLLAALSEPLGQSGTVFAGGRAYVAAGGLYLLAAMAFARHAWPRIAPFRILPRPGGTPTQPGE
jgi:hypothetical protein